MNADVLNMVQVELEPTKTYARRIVTWLPNADAECVPLGVLLVQLQHSRRIHAAFESDTYAVEETPSLFGMGRTFLLLNMSDPEVDEVYEVFIAPGGIAFCTCKAGQCKVPRSEGSQGCKHRDAILTLIAEGHL